AGGNGGTRLNFRSRSDVDVTRRWNGIRTLFALFKTNAQQTLGIEQGFAFSTRNNGLRIAAIFSRHEGDRLIFAHVRVIGDQDLAAFGQRIFVEEDVGRDDPHCTLAGRFVFGDFDDTIDFADFGFIFWYARFEEFFDTRQTLRDVALRACDTAGVEGTH